MKAEVNNVVFTGHSCDFCAEARSDQINPEFALAIGRTSRTLLRFPSVYVIPTLSPVVANHVLLVPTSHVTSRPQLDPTQRGDLAEAERHVRGLLASPAHSIVTFEHGIGEGRYGGCGVSHLHIHMMPLGHYAATEALRRLSQSPLGESLTDPLHLGPGDSYVHMRRETDSTADLVVRKGEFPSQFLRNLVEGALGVERTNWRDMVRSELLAETLVASHWI